MSNAADTGSVERPRWWRITRRVMIVVSALSVLTTPFWAPPALSRLAFFHVRRVEFEGIRHAKPGELTALLQLDTLQSVWQPLEPLVARITVHPLVADAQIERRFPATLLVSVTEKDPVALAPDQGRLVPVDADGRVLPIDPAAIDVPLAGQADSTLMRLLDGIRRSDPSLYARVTTVDRIGADEFRVALGALRVRTRSDVTVARFKDILPVEADLARSRLRATELDVRFRDQVIARLP